MASTLVWFAVHPAIGALNTFAASTLLPPDQLTLSENIHYRSDGSRAKRGDQQHLNTSTVGASAVVRGVRDFWRDDGSNGFTQELVITHSTKISTVASDGTVTDIKTGLQSDKIPGFAQRGGDLIISTDDNTDVPQVYDQTTMANLAGTPPNFAQCVVHHSRTWAWGVATNPSRIYYTAADNHEDWVGAGSGSIDIEPNDGDAIMNAVSWRGNLYIFKGPNLGSVHVITGSTPSDFARSPLFSGLESIGFRAVVPTSNDIFWMSRRGVHSLLATDKFGNVEESFISRQITPDWTSQNFAQRHRFHGFFFPEENILGFAGVPGGNTDVQQVWMLNIADTTNPKWSRWTTDCAAAARYVDFTGTKQRKLAFGALDGFLNKQFGVSYSDFGTTAYQGRFQTPVMYKFQLPDGRFVPEMAQKHFAALAVFFKPVGNYDLTVSPRVDNRDHADLAFNMSGSGFVLGTGVLGTDKLTSGRVSNFNVQPFENVGHSLQLDFKQGGDSQQMEIYGFAVALRMGHGYTMVQV